TEVAVSNYTADGLAGTWYDTIWVTDAPKVTSSSRDPDTGEIVGLVGEPLALTLNPGRPGVVRYEYTIESETASVAAGADGSATINWTPSYEGRPDISVVSVQADGSYSESSSTTIQVTDPRPFVSAFDYNPYYPTGGAGVTDTFLFETRMTGVVEFVVRLNGGEEIVVPASGGQGTQVLTPDRAGENVVSAQSRFADGSLSPAREWTFLVAG
ncbi:MAG TPA: hypothetical protein VGD43_22705, partial [Micromonospora sp.]